MAVTYGGIVSAGSTSGVVDGDVLSMPLTATVPASTPTVSSVITIFIVALGNRLTPGTPIARAPLIFKSPNFYNVCWVDPPNALSGNTSVGLSSGVAGGADSPLAWQLGIFVVLEDNVGAITVPMQLGSATDSGQPATVYWEIRQYTGIGVERLPTHTTWPNVVHTLDGSGFSYESDIPYSDNTANPYTGLIDTPAATNPTVGTFAALPAGVGLVPHVALAVGESDNGHAARFNTLIDSISYHDAGFTDQTLWTTTVTNADGTWSVGFAYAHYLNPPAGDLALGADFPAPSPPSETFTNLSGTHTLFFIYPTEGYAVALNPGDGPGACTVPVDYIKVFRHQHKAEAEATPFGGGSTPVGVFSQTPGWKP
jgi:hypothetical protein